MALMGSTMIERKSAIGVARSRRKSLRFVVL